VVVMPVVVVPVVVVPVVVVPVVGAVKVKLSALLVPAVVTAVTLAVVPVGSVGAVAEQVAPLESQTTLVAGVVPKLITVAGLRLLPVIATIVPAGPLEGLIVARAGPAAVPSVIVCVVGDGMAVVAGRGALALSQASSFS